MKNYIGMKTIYLILILLFISLKAQPQILCVTPTGEHNSDFTPILRMKNANASNENILCLNIYFHIVRMSDGSGGLQPYQLNEIIENLNSDFSAANIYFSLLGYDFINNSNYYTIEGAERDALFYFNNQNNAINFYIVMFGDGFNGYSQHIPGTNLILTQPVVFTSVSSHEIGHCLNLYHTHHGNNVSEPPSLSDPNACQEDVDSMNGDTCGDYIKDTPADPCLRDITNSSIYFVDNDCQYIGNVEYNPDTHNFMSYTKSECMSHFTNMQCIRMRDALIDQSILQPVFNCSCSPNLIMGKEVIKPNMTEKFSLPCASSGITWSVSSNLTKISEQSSYIMVQANSPSVNGIGWVQASISGNTFFKEIWIGKPKVNIVAVPSGNYVELEIVGDNSNVSQQGITKISWQKISGNGFLPIAPNEFETYANGNGYNWYVEAQVKVENTAGTTEKTITINAPTPPPCDPEFIIEQIDEGIYQIINIIDPCETYNLNLETNRKIVLETEIKKAQIIDLFSNVKRTFTKNWFDVRQLNSGVYIIQVILNKKIVTKKILVK